MVKKVINFLIQHVFKYKSNRKLFHSFIFIGMSSQMFYFFLFHFVHILNSCTEFSKDLVNSVTCLVDVNKYLIANISLALISPMLRVF